jgi:hypothetical protein
VHIEPQVLLKQACPLQSRQLWHPPSNGKHSLPSVATPWSWWMVVAPAPSKRLA